MQKITPFIWLEDKAEEAAKFYVSLFEKSKIINIMRYDKAGAEVSGRPEGSVMTVTFQLAGEEFVALNGGAMPVTENGETTDKKPLINPVSFIVNCKDQKEVDYFWEKLSEGGKKGICGWIYADKFGVTWQVVPTILNELLADPDPVKAQRVMEAMLKMKKIDIKGLQQAYNG